ncbi:DUF803-domain-containing protein [Serendipita vermifera]|nr:DUF803-domain-containing protein [Serendipita vermifera]
MTSTISGHYTSIGIAIAISGNILISLALNIQKVAHKHLHEARSATNTPGNVTTGSTTPNGLPLSRTASITPISSQHDFLESRPLLPRTASSPVAPQGYGAVKSKKLFNIPRIFKRSSQAHAPITSPRSANGELEYEHDDTDELDEGKATESDYLRSKLWWFGFLLMNVGEVGNFLSYAYAPASLVAPLGTVALVANCFFAPLMLHERFRKRDFVGIVLAVIGSITVVLSSKPTDVRLDMDGLIHAICQPIFIGYTIFNAILILFLAVLAQGNKGRQWVFIDVGICALFGGYTVLATKALSTLLSLELIQLFKLWITYPLLLVLIGTGVGQIRYLNRALMKFDSKHVIPTQFVMFNLTAIIGSAILYRDFENITLHKMISFMYGILTVFLAIFILTYSAPVPPSTGTPLVSLEDPIAVLTSPITPTTATDGLPETGTAVNIGGPNKFVLRTKASTAQLGISPGQYLLLATSPPTTDGVPRIRDPERGDFGSTRSRRGRSLAIEQERSRSPDPSRRRTIHFDGAPGEQT